MMTAAKGIFVKDIKNGQAFEGIFLVKELNRGETRAGKPFLRLKVLDKSGEIGGPVWDDAEALAPLCQPGSYLQISGQGDNYQGTPQLRINRLSPVEPDAIDPADFMPDGDFDRQALAAELDQLIEAVNNSHLQRLLQAIFQDDQALRQRFTIAPAAKSMHHAYLGGLLEHTMALARLAVAISRLYPGLDGDLLLAGALLHDLGKTEELTYEGYPFGYSNRGRLVGHLVIGAELIREKAANLKNFPPELTERLQHLILSHHGHHEFGAPTLPMMQEAFVLHFLDNMDAKISYFQRLNQQTTEPGYQWSDYQRNLERFLYLPGPAQEQETEPPQEEPTKTTPPPHQGRTAAGPALTKPTPSRGRPPSPAPADSPTADNTSEESSTPANPRQKPLW